LRDHRNTLQNPLTPAEQGSRCRPCLSGLSAVDRSLASHSIDESDVNPQFEAFDI
jgi:hypothetical protein